MDTDSEVRLLKHGLVSRQIHDEKTWESPLHIRRTLDQSHFLNLKDTSHRDQDQVVYRATRLPWRVPGNLTRVVMVDQLWMWILDDCRPCSFEIHLPRLATYPESFHEPCLQSLSCRYNTHSVSETLGTEQTGLFWDT